MALAQALIRERGPSRGQLGLSAFCTDNQGHARLRSGQGLSARSGHLQSDLGTVFDPELQQ